ncbi:MAG: type II toxin-antitoxin system HicA family toxin [Candidatus Kerfeldbacteria bacterium]|nr:type II toxin-antitoxin system HicA family toxin [Candidatus Kerfeldbacteria bacterium]
MPKLHSSDQVIAVLRRRGFVFVAQKGSHMKFRKLGKLVLTAIVPARRKEIPLGTFRSILRQARLDEADFS